MATTLAKQLSKRILILDGAMGTMIQTYQLSEEDFRGERFARVAVNVKGNNDLLSITQPHVIRAIHEQYLRAGADLIETNTFNANRISLADYQMEELAYELNLESARIARAVADRYTRFTPAKPRWVVGSIGPTNKTASISPRVDDPGYRAVTFNELRIAYHEQARGLMDGGADVLLVETIFDTLNAKAALMAIETLFEERGKRLPIMASVTIADFSGRTLSGQTLEAFLYSIDHFDLFAIGLNCSFGAKELRPHVKTLSMISPFPVLCYPNAGLPNQFGTYDETPETMANHVRVFLEEGWVNIIGGCCGTTPNHVQMLADLTTGFKPRVIPPRKQELRLCGLEPLLVYDHSNFINIGEQTNVSGSKKFARLIREEKFEEALSVARQQVENGAQILDINMDEPLLDAVSSMQRFLNMLAADPAIARVPIMIDSSDWDVITTGLQCIQGKPVVNSISLKEGEDIFRARALYLKKMGAVVIVMAFDEEGQATSFEHRTRIAFRAYTILTEELHFPAEEIIFDPNILAIATGIPEHNDYALIFLKTTSWIKANLPFVHVSGGISNLSFSFRGNETIRETMHSVFLYHAIRAGLDMAIVNAGNLPVYDDIPKDLLKLTEDAILNRRKDATERLIAYIETNKPGKRLENAEPEWRTFSLENRLTHSLIKGIPDFIDPDIDEALVHYEKALDIVEGPLIKGMHKVGALFEAGKMFLPQVVKSARVMKKAVVRLLPTLEMQKATNVKTNGQRGKIVLATVKGDVHDIGKNIVGVVLECNNYTVIDLGVMVQADAIIQAAIEREADIIGLSGLITPSLEEMAHVAREMKRVGLKLPLLIGGATTSEEHTALMIEPHASFPVIHVKDASHAATVVRNLLTTKKSYCSSVKKQYKEIRQQHANKQKQTYISINDARKNRYKIAWEEYFILKPQMTGNMVFYDFPLTDLERSIDWTSFFHAWKFNGKYPAILEDPVKGEEARKLFHDATTLLHDIIGKKMLLAKGIFGIYPCQSAGDDVVVYTDETRATILSTLHFLRNQGKKEEGIPNLCLTDFIAPRESGIVDYLGLFVVTAGLGVKEWVEQFEQELDDYRVILIKLLADRLAEAFAERLHELVRKEHWGYARQATPTKPALEKKIFQGIRPAPGYSTCPDHSEKETIFELLKVHKTIDVRLTENFAMYPAASVCGYYFSHPDSHYFQLGKIGKDQVSEYSRRKKESVERIEKLLQPFLNY